MVVTTTVGVGAAVVFAAVVVAAESPDLLVDEVSLAEVAAAVVSVVFSAVLLV